MTKDEALTVALQQIEVAVEYIDHLGGESGMYRAALVGLKKALAQPEQDCVGWFGYDTGLRLWFEANKGDDDAIPLYKARSET